MNAFLQYTYDIPDTPQEEILGNILLLAGAIIFLWNVLVRFIKNMHFLLKGERIVGKLDRVFVNEVDTIEGNPIDNTPDCQSRTFQLQCKYTYNGKDYTSAFFESKIEPLHRKEIDYSENVSINLLVDRDNPRKIIRADGVKKTAIMQGIVLLIGIIFVIVGIAFFKESIFEIINRPKYEELY